MAARAVRDLPRREQERHPLLIAEMVPHGSFPAASQTQYMAAFRACPDFAHYRSDGLTTLAEIAQVLCDHMDWELGTTRPTWATIMLATGRSKSTVARGIRALHEAGLAGTVATGRTAGSDPADPDGPNQAAVYVLTVPHGLHIVTGDGARRPHPVQDHPTAGEQQDQAQHDDVRQVDDPPTTDVDQTPASSPAAPALTSTDASGDEHDTPSGCVFEVGESNPTRARASDVRGLGPADLVAGGSWWMAGVAPITKQDRLLAAAELRRLEPILRRPGTSTAGVAAAVREWHQASVPSTPGQDDNPLPGWLVSDIRYAINHKPDGTLWPHQLTVADVRHPIAFIMFRLDAWRRVPGDRTSPPGLAPSQRTARVRAATAAAHAAELAADQATRTAAVTPTSITGWANARAEQSTHAALSRAQSAAARRLTLIPPAAAPTDRAPAAADRSFVRRITGSRRPVIVTADPRIAALRAAARGASRKPDPQAS